MFSCNFRSFGQLWNDIRIKALDEHSKDNNLCPKWSIMKEDQTAFQSCAETSTIALFITSDGENIKVF